MHAGLCVRDPSVLLAGPAFLAIPPAPSLAPSRSWGGGARRDRDAVNGDHPHPHDVTARRQLTASPPPYLRALHVAAAQLPASDGPPAPRQRGGPRGRYAERGRGPRPETVVANDYIRPRSTHGTSSTTANYRLRQRAQLPAARIPQPGIARPRGAAAPKRHLCLGLQRGGHLSRRQLPLDGADNNRDQQKTPRLRQRRRDLVFTIRTDLSAEYVAFPRRRHSRGALWLQRVSRHPLRVLPRFFDARTLRERRGAPDSKFILNQFGGVLGGPLKGQGLFFVIYEVSRSRVGKRSYERSQPREAPRSRRVSSTASPSRSTRSPHGSSGSTRSRTRAPSSGTTSRTRPSAAATTTSSRASTTTRARMTAFRSATS